MSSYWNYRILARKINDEVQYNFYEVHYENDVPLACTQNPVAPLGFDKEYPIESIKWQLDAMKLATEKPILDYDNFPNEYKKYSRKQKLEAIEEYFKKLTNIKEK